MSKLIFFALSCHLIWLVLFCYLFIGSSYSPAENLFYQLFPSASGFSGASTDAIRLAAELGRLDLVALSLTTLATVLGVGALAGFFLVRHAAMSEAATEAAEVTRRDLPNLIDYGRLTELMLKNPRFLSTLKAAIDAQELSDGSVAGDVANRIAETFGGEDGQ